MPETQASEIQHSGWALDAQLVSEIISGPAGATVIAVLAIYGLFKYGGPLLRELLVEHKTALSKIMDEHKEDRIAWKAGMEKIVDEIKVVHEANKNISKDIEDLSDKVDDLQRKVDRV